MRKYKILHLFYIFALLSTYCCTSKSAQEKYLNQVCQELDKIKSATYCETLFSENNPEGYNNFYKEYIAPEDTLVGAYYGNFSNEKFDSISWYYNGITRANVNWDKKYVKIDSFKKDPNPFRLVHYSIYLQTKEIIKYTLTTKDSIQTEFKDLGDTVFFSLKIYNKHVYFHIKPIVIRNKYIPEDEISQFDIWFSKKDNLPCKLFTKWYHTEYLYTYSDVKINTEKIETFIPEEYYPKDFNVLEFKRDNTPGPQKHPLEGNKAPNWNLVDADSISHQLENIKEDILLIQFTSRNCGPCQISIPFLNNLSEDLRNENFKLISIELGIKRMDSFKKHRDKKDIKYTFLKDDDTSLKYNVTVLPTFFILDKNRIVRKVIYGFDEKNTINEIKSFIDSIK